MIYNQTIIKLTTLTKQIDIKLVSYLSYKLLSPPISINARLYSAKEKPEIADLVYDKKNKVHRVGQKHTVETLEKLFDISTFTAYGIARKYKNLCRVNSLFLNNNYTKLLQNGITTATLIKYPQLLAETGIGLKINALKHLPYNINCLVILITIPLGQLSKFIDNECALKEENNRIATISQLLKIDVEATCNLLCQKPFLISMSLERIEENIKLLTGFGISTEDICRDLWVLRYSTKIITTKLSLAKKSNVEVMKTWMVRVQPHIFQTYVQRRSDNKLILGNNSLAEYLSERLECSVDVAKYLINKQPVLKNKSLKKIKEIIDLLYSQGFKSHQICRVPKILSHSTQTTRERLKLLESKGLQIDSVHILTKSQKLFKQYFEALLSKNKKTKNKS